MSLAEHSCQSGIELHRRRVRSFADAADRALLSLISIGRRVASAQRHADVTAIFPNDDAAIRAAHSFGPVLCTETPSESTATVTGMSAISNS